MKNNQNKTSDRKKEHIELCLHSDVSFRKSTGLENYEFKHNAITEIEIDNINFESEFLGKQISFPFLISSMTGGTHEAFELNERLAIAANELNIPIGVGSQRQALENDTHLESYKVIRKYASNVPVLSNIGGAQISKLKELSSIKRIIDMVEADAVIIHLNPLQELLQKEGETNFTGLLDNIEKLKKYITKPVIIKEVGSGISKEVAEKLLNVGVDGIDVAGAGGTSWAAVELIRNKINDDNYFRDWGLPTSYCIRKVAELKANFDFILIGSGGLNDFINVAKALALGADIAASARIILITLYEKDTKGVVDLISNWFNEIKKIMYLTGSGNLSEFRKDKLILKKELY